MPNTKPLLSIKGLELWSNVSSAMIFRLEEGNLHTICDRTWEWLELFCIWVLVWRLWKSSSLGDHSRWWHGQLLFDVHRLLLKINAEMLLKYEKAYFSLFIPWTSHVELAARGQYAIYRNLFKYMYHTTETREIK